MVAEQLANQLDGLTTRPRLGTPLTGIRSAESGIDADLGEGWKNWQVILLCSGTRPRLLGLPGEADLHGRGVETAVTRNLARYAGCVVAIVGGGDGALEGALLLAQACTRVHLLHRGGSFIAQPRFVDRVARHPRITTHLGSRVSALCPEDGTLAGIDLEPSDHLDVDALFVRIGVEPSLPEGVPADAIDEDGYLRTDNEGRTTMSGLWAAGDLTGRNHQSVAWAQGTGARAAAAIAQVLARRVSPS